MIEEAREWQTSHIPSTSFFDRRAFGYIVHVSSRGSISDPKRRPRLGSGEIIKTATQFAERTTQMDKAMKYVGALVEKEIHEMLAKTKEREDRSQAAIIKRALRKYCSEAVGTDDLHKRPI